MRTPAPQLKAVRRRNVRKMSEQFPGMLETDEVQDALASLELVAETLPRTMSTIHLWKWVVISLHNALQGFMVLALKGPDGLRPLTEKSSTEWMEAYTKGNVPYPEPRLDWFPNLYTKVKSDTMKIYGHSREFSPSGTQEQSVERLNELRRGFVHFTPKLLALDVSVFPRMVADIASVIEFLGFESNNVLWIDESDASKAQALLSIIKSEAIALEDYFGA